MTFSALLRDAGVDTAELAQDFGVPQSQVIEWENGQAVPPDTIVQTLKLMADFSASSPRTAPQKSPGLVAREGSFVDNMRLPIHRWFRYSAGFSAAWAESVIRERKSSGHHDVVLDPFAGSGTVQLAALSNNVPSIGVEPHPFVYRIAQAKLGWDVDVGELRSRKAALLRHALAIQRETSSENALLQRCYTPDNLTKLVSLREAFAALETFRDDNVSRLLWLAITSILRETSGVGTAQWQYLLPNKSKAKVVDTYAAFETKVECFCADICGAQTLGWRGAATLLNGDARDETVYAAHRDAATLVITSPPYPNNFDYADATRLEMTFWGEVSSWGGLQDAVRHRLLRSCSQHTAAEKLDLETLLASLALDPIRKEIEAVCRELATVRLQHGGKKSYHTMIAAYFLDLAASWRALRTACAADSTIVFVIGDSAPYGVHAPADKWLAALAEAAGFGEPRFEKLRDRNLKWKNRKHTVPLIEGRLWLRG